MAKGKKTGGRKAGSTNKSTVEGREYVDRVRARLKAQHKLTLEQVSVELLAPTAPAAIRQRELQDLRQYEYGKPVQPIVSGDETVVPFYIVEPSGGVRRK